VSLELYQRGRIWHYRGTVAGRRVRGTTRATDKATAQRIAAETEAREWRRHLDGAEEVLTMAQAILAYLDAGKPDRFLKPIADHWKETRVKTITPEAIRQSARKLYPTAGENTWTRQVIVPTAAVINHAAAMGWCSPIKVKRFSAQAKAKTPADLEWIMAFADQAVADGLPHLAALCLFMFGTGARIGEAVALTWGAVDLQKRRAIVNQTKTKHARIAHLPASVVAAMANIPSNRHQSDLVFGYACSSSTNKVWKSVADRAGIAPLSPHCCRHGFATTMLRNGFDVKTVAKLGGWKDPAIVLRTYAHALEDHTVTDALFDTILTQVRGADYATFGQERKNSA